MLRFAVPVLMVLLAGCQVLTVPGDRAAELFGRVKAPERVLGLDHAAIAEIGAQEGECSELYELHAQGERVRRDLLEQRLLPECGERIREAQEKLEGEQEALLLAAREARRIEEERQRRAREQRQREQQEQEQDRREAISEFVAREEILFREARLGEAAVHHALEEIPERPVAHFTGQPGKAPLHRFLACMEISYSNDGYEVEYAGRELELLIRNVGMPRGRVPVEMRFLEQGDYWLMTHLKVADIEAGSAEDRFVLSQNLVVQGCPEDSDLFGF